MRVGARSFERTLPRFCSSTFYPFLGEGSPTKIDDRKKGTLILPSLLEDLVPGDPSLAD